MISIARMVSTCLQEKSGILPQRSITVTGIGGSTAECRRRCPTVLCESNWKKVWSCPKTDSSSGFPRKRAPNKRLELGPLHWPKMKMYKCKFYYKQIICGLWLFKSMFGYKKLPNMKKKSKISRNILDEDTLEIWRDRYLKRLNELKIRTTMYKNESNLAGRNMVKALITKMRDSSRVKIRWSIMKFEFSGRTLMFLSWG